MKKSAAILMALALSSTVVYADEMAVAGKVGTLGVGAELSMPIADGITGRVGLNMFSYGVNTTRSTVNYDMKLQLQTISALADWYPMDGGFRTSAGLFYNNNKATFNALPAAGGSFVINGNTTYNTGNVTSLQGSMTFNSLAPYIGIGWGNPVAKDKGWGFVADIGLLYQGTPKASLTATGTALGLANDVALEQAKLQSALNSFTWYPVAMLGLSYQW
ncbi:MAG: hypothetical protein WAO71_00545 [Gallionella sp.]